MTLLNWGRARDLRLFIGKIRTHFNDCEAVSSLALSLELAPWNPMGALRLPQEPV